jgi:hypothetical protein
MSQRIWSGKLTLMVALTAVALFIAACEKSDSDSTSGTSQKEPAKNEPTTAGHENFDKETGEPWTAGQQAKEGKEEIKPKPDEQPKKVSDDLVPLQIELPKPMFVGTPTNIRVENLEKPLGKPRPPFLAPAGCTNVALNKKVASSDPEPIIGDLELMTDGDKEGIDGSWVELGPMVQWAQIDLGAKHDIYAVLFWHYHRQARVYFDVIVQVADDPDFITNVRTIFNNDLDNSAGQGIGKDMHYIETSEGKLVDAKGVQARYVRLYSNGSSANDQNHYTEIEVYGKPAQ